ncbi:MAG: tyrosine-type recombinase/integrase, partial [Bacilli bacterium]|nr:tyrosine-type recombinase/integrase [Bacilli bacterium]
MDKNEFEKLEVINDFINHIKQKNYSNNTLVSYINDLYYFYNFINKNLTKVKEEDIRDYLEYLNLKKENPTSVRRKISTFKSFYKFLYTNDYIDKKDYPLVRIAYPKTEKKLPKFIYYNDLLEILEASSKTNDSYRDKLIIEMLYATGLRVSELINIRIRDIDFNNRRIVVMGKGSKERTVYYGEYAEEVLKKYLDTHTRKEHGYLFVNQRGEQLTDRGVRSGCGHFILSNCFRRSMCDLLDRPGCAAQLLAALLHRAVDDFVVAALCVAGCILYILANCFARSMGDLINRLGRAAQLLAAFLNRTVDDFVVT